MADQDKCPVTVADAKQMLVAIEEIQKDLLSLFAELKGTPGIDARWLQIGVTDVEKGFMSIHRAIFEPQHAEILQAAILDAMKG